MKNSNFSLYQHYIHFNEFSGTWNLFHRNEEKFYLSDKKSMETLKTFNSIDELLDYIRSK